MNCPARAAVRASMHSRSSSLAPALLCAGLLYATTLATSQAGVFTVTQPGDDGPGSLREAIGIANATSGSHTITFATPQAIELTSPLPVLACDVAIIDEAPHGVIRGNVAQVFETAPGHTITISGLTISSGGSAVFNRGSHLTVRNCTFDNNAGFAVKNTAVGTQGGILVLDNCAFVIVAAGGITNDLVAGSFITVTNSTFYVDSGEAIRNQGLAGVINCTFSVVNPAGAFGSAISDTGATASLSLQNCTLVGNSDSNSTTLLYTGDSSQVSLSNNIFKVSGMVRSIRDQSFRGPRIFSSGHNISSDSADGDANTGPGGFLNKPGDIRNTDPLLDSELYDNGGRTRTYALLAGSPAINNADQTQSPARDQRNFIRPDAADIGAYEYHGTIPATLANISTRAMVGTGDDVLIAGFIGATSRSPDRVLLRGIGPSLPLANALADPQLEVREGGIQTIVGANDNWGDAPNKDAIAETGIAPTNPSEAAVLAPLASTGPAGAYADTAQVKGAHGETGIALVEVYDLDRISAPKFLNLSTRGLVGTGDDGMIAGFIVLGPDSLRVTVRALGPSLRFSGLGQVLDDPTFTVYDANGFAVAANDNWRAGGQETELTINGLNPTEDREAAAITEFGPGGYTAVVQGVGDTTGVALIELYRLN